jgi:hypothetical protein
MEKWIEGIPQAEGFFNIDADVHKRAYADIDSESWEEKLNELFDFLTGAELPKGVDCKIPHLSKEKAMDIIWFLQEITGIIPENFDRCDICGYIRNTDGMFYSELNGKYYCGESCFDHAPVIHCEECGDVMVYKSRSYSQKDEMYLCKDCRKKKCEEQND